MQSKNNQVVILGISIFEKPEQTVESNRWPTELEKRYCHPTLPLLTGLQTYFLLIQCSGHVQSKNGVDLVEMEVKIFRPTKLE